MEFRKTKRVGQQWYCHMDLPLISCTHSNMGNPLIFNRRPKKASLSYRKAKSKVNLSFCRP